MPSDPLSRPPIVFLHIPKTAGQSVHNAISCAVGHNRVSPVRVHTQAKNTHSQFPPDFDFYSGHLDWTALERVPKPRFVFSILRDPQERIASFYFYLRKEAKTLSKQDLELPHNQGKKAALQMSADDYFFSGPDNWKAFVRDHYDNFYCRYFASKKVRAGAHVAQMSNQELLREATKNIKQIDWIYHVDALDALEDDFKTLYGFEMSLKDRSDNLGDRPRSEARWPRLLNYLEKDKSSKRLQEFTLLDQEFMSILEL